jgi:DNA-binding transcriptional LysR family regulator
LSFTRAAEELFLTQSAVSREIKTLEEQLGQTLFTRVNRGLRLTDAGQALYRAVGEALAIIDEATDRVAGSKAGETLTVTTSVPLASMWLVPKLRRFVSLHPQVDVRSVAANQKLDLDRERLDVGIRWAPHGSTIPGAEQLFNVQIFPVCAPALAQDPARPLESFADLRKHVLLDLETVTEGGRWSDWAPWLAAMKFDDLKPAGTLRFSHYDQVVQAAIDGSGIAIGRKPHNAHHLREGLLVEPLGPEARLAFGTYFVLVRANSNKRAVVRQFVAWLHDEARQEFG